MTNEKPDVMPVLVDNYVDITARNDEELPLTVAEGCIDTVKVCLEKGPKYHDGRPESMLNAASPESLEIVDCLSAAGAEVGQDDILAAIILIAAFKCRDCNPLSKYLILGVCSGCLHWC